MHTYQAAATLLSQHGNLKTLLFQKHTSLARLYPLLFAARKNYSILQEAVTKIADANGIVIDNMDLAVLLAAELIRRGKLKGGGKLTRLLKENLQLLPQLPESKSPTSIQARVIGDYKGTLVDKLIPDLYKIDYSTYKERFNQNIFIPQSRGSALPAALLLANHSSLFSDQPFDIIDCAAAPGNKTLQLAAYSPSSTLVYAFDRDQKRFQILKNRCETLAGEKIQCSLQNFMEVDLTDQKFRRVKLILVDPSCSGSGMRDNQFAPIDKYSDYRQFCLTQFRHISQEQILRVKKLAQFQLRILLKASQIRPFRISYSTCSIFQQENQCVVQKFLESCTFYRLQSLKKKPDWIVRGWDIRQKTMRIEPKGRDGIFLAIFRLKQK